MLRPQSWLVLAVTALLAVIAWAFPVSAQDANDLMTSGIPQRVLDQGVAGAVIIVQAYVIRRLWIDLMTAKAEGMRVALESVQALNRSAETAERGNRILRRLKAPPPDPDTDASGDAQ